MKTIAQSENPELNLSILSKLEAEFNSVTGARVGDFLRLPVPHDARQPDYTRFTHDWGHQMQTGGTQRGSYFIGGQYLSYSGGLDPGIATADLIATPFRLPGSVWWFDSHMTGAGRGVCASIECRVFDIRPGANLDGLNDFKCPFWLSSHLTPVGCGYLYTIQQQGTAHTAFKTKAELEDWLVKNKLAATCDLSATSQRLAYI